VVNKLIVRRPGLPLNLHCISQRQQVGASAF